MKKIVILFYFLLLVTKGNSQSSEDTNLLDIMSLIEYKQMEYFFKSDSCVCSKIENFFLLHYALAYRDKDVKNLIEEFPQLNRFYKENFFLVEIFGSSGTSSYLIVNDSLIYVYRTPYGEKQSKKLEIKNDYDFWILKDLMRLKGRWEEILPVDEHNLTIGGGCYFVTRVSWDDDEKPSITMGLFYEYSPFKPRK